MTVSIRCWRSSSVLKVFLALNEHFGYGLEEFFDLTVKALENYFSTEEERQQERRR